MTITFDDITLPDDMKMNPLPHALHKVEAETQWSRGGKQIRWERARKAAEFDLMGGDDWGWLQRSHLTALIAKADAVDTSYTLDYHGTEFTVFFRHEAAPYIEADEIQILRGEDESANDWFNNVKIKLMWDYS